jgi:hypothetical protein
MNVAAARRAEAIVERPDVSSACAPVSRQERWAIVLGLVLAAAAPASAQDRSEVEPPTFPSLDAPDRALALRPVAMVESALTWGTGELEYCRTHLAVASIDARAPVDDLLLEISLAQATYYARFEDWPMSYDGTYVRVGNPRLGAAWHQRGDGWRGEIGGAVNMPFVWDETPDRLVVTTAAALFFGDPGEFEYARYRGGWNAFQLAPNRFAVIAHTRWEFDPHPAVALGVELDVPLVLEIDAAETVVLPQVAIEGAWRFLRASMIGARAQLVTTHIAIQPRVPFPRAYGAVALIEPFVRFVADDEVVPWFAAVSLQITLGPDQAPSFTTGVGACEALFGLRVGGGVFF